MVDFLEEHNYLSARMVNELNNALAMNKDLLGYKKQLQQYTAAKKEIEGIKKEIESGKIEIIHMPTIGKIIIPVSAKDKKVGTFFDMQTQQFNTSINGIIGQISHRHDVLNELVLKILRYVTVYMKDNNLKPQRDVGENLKKMMTEKTEPPIPTKKPRKRAKKGGK